MSGHAVKSRHQPLTDKHNNTANGGNREQPKSEHGRNDAQHQRQQTGQRRLRSVYYSRKRHHRKGNIRHIIQETADECVANPATNQYHRYDTDKVCHNYHYHYICQYARIHNLIAVFIIADRLADSRRGGYYNSEKYGPCASAEF